MGTIVQNIEGATVVAADEKLVSFCAVSIRKSLQGSLDPEHIAFLSHLEKVAEQGGSLPFYGKFILIGKMDQGRVAYFIYPTHFGQVGDSRMKIKIPDIPEGLVKAICERCGSVGLVFVREGSCQSVAIGENMGRIGTTNSLGRIVDVIE